MTESRSRKRKRPKPLTERKPAKIKRAKHGGKRPGAGRPTASQAERIAKAKRIGWKSFPQFALELRRMALNPLLDPVDRRQAMATLFDRCGLPREHKVQGSVAAGVASLIESLAGEFPNEAVDDETDPPGA